MPSGPVAQVFLGAGLADAEVCRNTPAAAHPQRRRPEAAAPEAGLFDVRTDAAAAVDGSTDAARRRVRDFQAAAGD